VFLVPKRKKKRRRKGGVAAVTRLSAGLPSSFTARPFARKRRTTVTYCESINMSTGTGGQSNYYVLSANGLFDPNISGTGHQPYGFDQWMTMYDHYTVLNCWIEVTAKPVGTTGDELANGSIVVNVRPDAGATPTTYNPAQVQEVADGATGFGSWYQFARAKNSVSIGKFLSQKPLQEDANAGTLTANPTEQVYWHVTLGQFNKTTGDTVDCDIYFKLKYDVVFHEPKRLATS